VDDLIAIDRCPGEVSRVGVGADYAVPSFCEGATHVDPCRTTGTEY
jgi:hypothetical protein